MPPAAPGVAFFPPAEAVDPDPGLAVLEAVEADDTPRAAAGFPTPLLAACATREDAEMRADEARTGEAAAADIAAEGKPPAGRTTPLTAAEGEGAPVASARPLSMAFFLASSSLEVYFSSTAGVPNCRDTKRYSQSEETEDILRGLCYYIRRNIEGKQSL